MQLREIMTLDVEVVDSKAVLKEAAAKMKHLDVGVIPVCDGEKLKGMLTDRDITVRATAEGRNPAKTKVSEIMSTDLAYCFEDQQVEEAVSRMEVKQFRNMTVLIRDNRLLGV